MAHIDTSSRASDHSAHRQILRVASTWLIALSALIATPGCGSSTVTEDDDASPTCHGPDGGMAADESYMDDCNTCTCSEDGTISCTEEVCAACTVEGKEYDLGESWPAGDGCNICQCNGKDEVACTEVGCK